MNTKRIKVHVFEIVDASRCLETSDRGNVWIKSKTRDVSAVTRSSISDLGGLYIYIFFIFIFSRYWMVNSVDWRILFFLEFVLFFISFICILYERNSKMHARSFIRDGLRFSSGD